MIPIQRIIILSIVSFFAMIFGSFYHIITTFIIFNCSYNKSEILKLSFYFILFVYIFMIISLYSCPNFFNTLYYLFFLLMSFYINLFFSSIIFYLFYILNANFSLIMNLFLYHFLGIFSTLIGMYYEKNIFYDKIFIHIPNFNGKLTIAHLSDLHLGAVYGREFVKKIVDMLKNEEIDLVVITGDIVDGNRKMTKEMIEPFNSLSKPIYYVTGNHEDFSYKEEVIQIIENSNIIHLKNETVKFNDKINIIGIDYNPDFNNVKYLLSNLIPKNNLPNIFLFHVPIFNVKELFNYNISLFLCGHTHGGQLFPMNIVQYIVSPAFEGLYNFNNNNYIYCSSGVGTSGPPIRTMSKAKIGILNLIGNN